MSTDIDAVGRAVDDLTTADIGGRGTVGPIAEATAAAQGPLPAMRAAERLADAVDPGDVVVVLTGFPIPPAMVPDSDGPPGAASLARAVDALGANPLVACEPAAVEVCEAAATAGGLRVLDRDACLESAHTAAVEPFPAEPAEADAYAGGLLDLDPAAVLAVEKVGPNRAGTFHNMAGYDVGEATAKVDALYERLDGSVLTVAVGDSGNEIGMGVVEETVRSEVQYGEACQCECDAGIACATAADVLVPAAVSNWGAHAVVTCLAAVLGEPLLHDPAVERRMLVEAGMAGGIDGIAGGTTGWCDGLPTAVHEAVVRLLREIPRESVHARGGGELGR